MHIYYENFIEAGLTFEEIFNNLQDLILCPKKYFRRLVVPVLQENLELTIYMIQERLNYSLQKKLRGALCNHYETL